MIQTLATEMWMCEELVIYPLSFGLSVTLLGYIRDSAIDQKYTFLGLLAKIKCSICSYQFNI
jgi:hypothetical protein